ncbi:hypothetical protein BZA05DRAFT_421314 [Tricharina praecox]|uniref:uncharacterized protein n=1 Tax=Tricharina praecox TaxID=43433 RepID=UPI00221F5872|nr:uncharacterized protein BZA05DRAFT_421314 [Tricharina praecox]KAI5845486.1 hypothetical protein BZA05DRAFT_421314 [Tricharina praecox]
MGAPHHTKTAQKPNTRTAQAVPPPRSRWFPPVPPLLNQQMRSCWFSKSQSGDAGRLSSSSVISHASQRMRPQPPEPQPPPKLSSTLNRAAMAALHKGARIEVKPLTALPERKENETLEQWEFLREGLGPEDEREKRLAREKEKEAEKLTEAQILREAKQERAMKAEKHTKALVAEHIRQKHARLALERQVLAEQEAERSRQEVLRLESQEAVKWSYWEALRVERELAAIDRLVDMPSAGGMATALHRDASIDREEVH